MVYRLEGEKFPYPHKKIGRVLGPENHAGNEMSQWVLTKAGKVMPIQTLRRFTPAELADPSMKERQMEFNEAIKERLGSETKSQDKVDDDLEDDSDMIYNETYEGHYNNEENESLADVDEY